MKIRNKRLKREGWLKTDLKIQARKKAYISKALISNQNMFLLGKLFLLLLKPLTWIIVIFLIALISKKP